MSEFERRKSDGNVSSLALRVEGLEKRMEMVEDELKSNGNELRENTKITHRIHKLIEGDEGFAGGERVKGMRDKVTEMYDIVETAQSGFRIIGQTGDFFDRNGRRLFWMSVVTVACITYLRTGHLPDWLVKLIA